MQGLNEEKDLKDMFTSFAQNSKKCKQELVSEINKLGGTATDGTTVSGKFFRGWMDMKSALIGKDRKAILESCEYGEEQADETTAPERVDVALLAAEFQIKERLDRILNATEWFENPIIVVNDGVVF